VIAHFNEGIPASVTWPGWTDRLVQLPLLGIDYSVARLVLLFLGLGVGLGLWLWLYRTRTGLVIRAGVDDRQMASALGVNIHFTFAIAFVVGSALAAFGGVVGTSQGSISVGQDGQWLLNSLVVVIIGGMGSLGGAAIGSLLLGLTTNFAAAYLPSNYTYYSIIFTFVLLAIVLAVRPLGLFGRPA
jgi:branched-chain amino acid transport system permease protein